MPALPAYPWPLKPFAAQHPVRGFLCDPRIAGGGRTFHFGIDIAAPAGTAVYAVAPGKVSYGSPGDVNANGGIVVVEASNRNFGYWHVKPTVQPGSHVPLHALLGHIAAQPEDWGHVHFAESTHDRNGITYWNPLRPGAISPFHDYGPPVIEAIIASLPPKRLHGLVDFSVKAHDNTPIAVTQAKPPGWHGMPVTPARIRWRLTRNTKTVVPWQVVFDHRNSFRPHDPRNPAERHQLRRRLHTPTRHKTTPTARATTTSGSRATSTPTTTPTATTASRSKQATSAATRERPPST